MKTLFAAVAMAATLVAGTVQAGCGTCDKTIVEAAEHLGTFNTLVAAIDEADLKDTLMGDGPYTVFAPSDEAFKELPAGTVENLLKPENKEKLQAILKYHVVPGKVKAAQVMSMSEAKTVEGSDVMVSVKGGDVMIDDAKVVKADVPVKNGVIHVIDKVIMPKS